MLSRNVMTVDDDRKALAVVRLSDTLGAGDHLRVEAEPADNLIDGGKGGIHPFTGAVVGRYAVTNAGDAAGHSDQYIRNRLQAEQSIRPVLAQSNHEPQEQSEKDERRAGARSWLKEPRAVRQIAVRPEQIPFFDMVTLSAHRLSEVAREDRSASVVVRRAEKNDRPRPV